MNKKYIFILFIVFMVSTYYYKKKKVFVKSKNKKIVSFSDSNEIFYY
jgi:hypothetical protein